MALTKVTSGMRTLATDEVLTANINDDAVTTAKVLDDAVTVAKMNDSAYLANRNLIINGACSVAQRSTSIQKQYDSGNGCWAIDRMRQTVFGLDQLVYTTSQQSDGPDGFANSIKMLVDTAETSMTTDEDFICQQFIEAQNLQNLAFGTSSAESLTLSFWVKSNVTGVYAVNFYQSDASRNIGATYEISSSATWEYKTITIAGDTAGTINDDTGTGLAIWWFLSAGPDRRDTDNTSWAALTTGRNAYGHAVDVAGTASNYWQMTGAQLEVGSTATPFEHKTYGQELEGCQRYYLKLGDTGGSGYATMGFATAASTSRMTTIFHFPTTMRGTPSSTYGGTLSVLYGTIRANITSQPDAQLANYGGYVNYDVSGSPFTVYTYSGLIGGNGDATTYVAFDAEL